MPWTDDPTPWASADAAYWVDRCCACLAVVPGLRGAYCDPCVPLVEAIWQSYMSAPLGATN